MATPQQPPVLGDVAQPALDLIDMPCWFYDAADGGNLWGNRAARARFQAPSMQQFNVSQLDVLKSLNDAQQSAWRALNERIKQTVQVQQQDVCVRLDETTSLLPGFPAPLQRQPPAGNIFQYRPATVQELSLREQLSEDNQLRMVEICRNHPMFQFLFDEEGLLLSANQRALANMQEHLGPDEPFTLERYLSIGEYDGKESPDKVYRDAMAAIFKHNKPCHRLAQLRWSKRHQGKFRWVLYEMWPMQDPVTGRRAVLVCEQNISQVKAAEESIRKQNKRLEAQLEEALALRHQHHTPAIDIDTPADKTLKLLDKLMRGLEVSPKEALELHDAILKAGDLRQPVNLSEQLMRNNQGFLDNEVSQSLLQLLTSQRRPSRVWSMMPPEPGRSTGSSPLARTRGGAYDGPGSPTGSSAEAAGYQTLTSGPLTRTDSLEEAAHALLDIVQEVPDPLARILESVQDWQFDAFLLDLVTNGRPLSVLSFYLFKRCDLVTDLELNEHKLARFLSRIEDGYPQNPYHNRIHAADVLRTTYVLLTRGGVRRTCGDAGGVLACLLSAIVHDFEHKGVNNDMLIRMSDTLAVLYNDRSPMENHHLAAAFKLLNAPDTNFMSKVPKKTREQLRKQVIDMVLATDMKQHFSITSMFQAKMQLATERLSGNGTKGLRSGGHHAAHTSGATGQGSTGGAGGGPPAMDEDQRSLALQVALKCADLGHLATPRPVHRRWVCQLEEEFFRQGDNEKAHGLTVSPLMDREKSGITKSQVGFFDIVALPLFQSFTQAYPDAGPMLDAVRENYDMWKEEALNHGSGASGK